MGSGCLVVVVEPFFRRKLSPKGDQINARRPKQRSHFGVRLSVYFHYKYSMLNKNQQKRENWQKKPLTAFGRAHITAERSRGELRGRVWSLYHTGCQASLSGLGKHGGKELGQNLPLNSWFRVHILGYPKNLASRFVVVLFDIVDMERETWTAVS